MARLPSKACIYPFRAAMLMHGEPATPCCRFHTRFLDNDLREAGEQMDPKDFISLMRTEFKDNIKDYTNTFSDIRETMMRNEWHPGCYKCKSDEEVKGSSMRTEADEFFTDFTDEVRLEYLEITVGRHCNLKCMSCGPEYSNKWDKDAIKFPELGNSAYNIEQLKKIEELDLDSVDVTTLKHVRNIKVTGGEPFLHPQFLRFVTQLAEHDIAQNVHIEIFTNCTWWPKKADYDSLIQFRKITVCPSIDAVGEVNDVLRFPSKWDRVTDTLNKWIATRDELGWDKIEIKAATTISVVNAPYMWEFFMWCQHQRIGVQFQTVYEPNYLSIEHWPDWYKDKLKFLVNHQFETAYRMQDQLTRSGKIRWDKMQKLHKLLVRLCNRNAVEDNSYAYTDILKKVLKHRGIESFEKINDFKHLLDLDAKPVTWGPGSRAEWSGRYEQE